MRRWDISQKWGSTGQYISHPTILHHGLDEREKWGPSLVMALNKFRDINQEGAQSCQWRRPNKPVQKSFKTTGLSETRTRDRTDVRSQNTVVENQPSTFFWPSQKTRATADFVCCVCDNAWFGREMITIDKSPIVSMAYLWPKSSTSIASRKKGSRRKQWNEFTNGMEEIQHPISIRCMPTSAFRHFLIGGVFFVRQRMLVGHVVLKLFWTGLNHAFQLE